MCICRCSDGSNKTLCTWRDLTETEPDLPLSVWVNPEEVCVSSGLPQGQGLWVQQTWVWHKPSWRRLPLTPPQSHQNFHRNGETDSWRAKTKSVHSRTQEKGAVAPQETDPDLPGVSRSLWWRHGSVMAYCRGHWVRQCMHRTFWRRSPLSSLPPP